MFDWTKQYLLLIVNKKNNYFHGVEKQIVLKDYGSLVNWKSDIEKNTDCSFPVVEYL